MSDITCDDIEKVLEYLKTRANVKPKQLVYFSDIERELGREVYSSQWHLLLDPIYEEVKLSNASRTSPVSWCSKRGISKDTHHISVTAARFGRGHSIQTTSIN
jgi:hypothetical protein